ncbi:MAG: hypothetical protein WBQ50_19605 [Nocardioides sp.]
MTTFLFLLTIIGTAWLLATLRDVLHDGYGHNPVPTDRYRDLFDPRNHHVA